MEKKEKKSDLEWLLNSLIEKGWKPFGESRIEEINRAEQYAGNWNWCCWGGAMQKRKSTRQIASKESGLWQFVCENGMVNVDETEVYYFWLKRKGTLDRGHYYLSEAGEDIRTNNFEYRLIESSLKDESELEDFLLSNIKVEGEGQKHS